MLRSEMSQAYLEQSVMTAGPGELTLMLYEGCIKFLRKAKDSVIEKNVQKSHEFFMKSEMILRQLCDSLDMSYKISEDLLNLYSFWIDEITSANIDKNPDTVSETIDPVIDMLISLRDSWKEAVKSERKNGGVLHDEA